VKRRTQTVTSTRTAPPRHLLEPRIADWITKDDAQPRRGSTVAGRDLAKIAEGRHRTAVANWYAEWSGPYDDTAPVDLVDFATAQRRAREPSEVGDIMRWARAVSIGLSIPWQA
jgi:hypothetical protein